jgi:alkylation response protein AidB-like acyl-CoA dehydrogenase
MNLDFSSEDAAFRDEVRAFIAENYPADLRDKQEEGEEMAKQDFLSWHRILARKGWVAPAWPTEYGGPGWTPVQRYIWSEETARADCVPILPFGINMVGPVIYTFATPEQKQRFLPPTLSGDIWWAQGYSEPGAGSDLASLKTKAERIRGDDGEDYYLVNGQKTWTSLAQFADWIFFLVRTDPDAKPQEGISFLLIDMKIPGVTVRPIITLDGGHEVNDVFLDNVKVPVENRIGMTRTRAGPAPRSCSPTSARASPAWRAPSAAREAPPDRWPRSVSDDGAPLIDDRCSGARSPSWRST